MEYETAKRLKGAGFPQDNPSIISVDKSTKVSEYEATEVVKYPTLSELIEACGADFLSLVFEREYWNAHAYRPFTDENETLESYGKRQIKKTGSIPEEAVAKLWLALNHH